MVDVMWPPRTPSKKGTEKFLPIPSPYFSSASIRVAPEHIIHTLFKPECMASPEDSPENLKEESDTLHNDPLFFYYFRAFLRLYRQLTLLKPVMIQGCSAWFHFVFALTCGAIQKVLPMTRGNYSYQ